jgi:hypothetical protein
VKWLSPQSPKLLFKVRILMDLPTLFELRQGKPAYTLKLRQGKPAYTLKLRQGKPAYTLKLRQGKPAKLIDCFRFNLMVN